MGLPTPNEIFQASHGLIKNVRNAQFNQQTHRLVFELTEDVRLSSEELSVSNDSALPRLKINMQWRNAPKVAKPFKPNNTPNVQTNSVNKPKATAPKPAPATITPLKKLVVAIDAGHGGKDPGAIGKNKTQEKKIVLSVSKKLANLINKDPRMEAVLTRTGDYYVGLGKRTQIAREAHADVFLSIHADAVVRRTAKGSSVYVLSNKRASSEFAKMLAKNENAAFADGVLNGKEEKLKHVLLDMSKDYVLHESTLMATDILSSLSKVGSVHSRKIGRAGFAVLKSLDIPSVLIETAFISNPGEEKSLIHKRFKIH
jgi:N-acetylmuramoyl-L-alanine amidase